MLFSQGNLLPSTSYGKVGYDPSTLKDEELATPTVVPVGDTQTDNAVKSVDDELAIQFKNDSFARMLLLIEQLNAATSKADLGASLEAIENFARESGSPLIEGLLSEVRELLETSLDAIDDNPAAFAGGFNFSFNADITQSSFKNGDYSQDITAVSLSFSLQTADTSLSGKATFGEALTISDEGVSYAKIESVSVSVVTFNADLENNAVFDGFFDIASRLLEDFANELGIELPKPQEQVEEQPEAYEPVSPYDLLNIEYDALDKLLKGNEYFLQLLELLTVPQDGEATTKESDVIEEQQAA